MNRLILSLILLMATSTMAYAQDVLVTEDGESIQAYDVDISGSQKIYYKVGAGDDAPMKSIAKEKVLLWKRADGTKQRIGQDAQPQLSATTTTNAQNPLALDVSDAEANRAAIAAFNAKGDFVATKEPGKKFRFTGGRKYNTLGCLLNIGENSHIADKNMELDFHEYSVQLEKNYYYMLRGVSIVAKNKTDRTIYVYLGNTFFLRHGIASPFNVSSASQSAGDGMAAATGFSQSVVAVPAHSSIDLGSQMFFPRDEKNYWPGVYTLNWSMGHPGGTYWERSEAEAWRVNEMREFSPNNSPFDFGFKLTYSFSENNTQLYSLNANLYVRKICAEQFNVVGAPLAFYVLQKVLK